MKVDTAKELYRKLPSVDELLRAPAITPLLMTEGHAALASAAIDRIRDTATVYSNLEFDVATGERGRRDEHAQRLFARLLNPPLPKEGKDGAPDDRSWAVSTVVVNNNA